METEPKFTFNEILQAVKQLPEKQRAILLAELNEPRVRAEPAKEKEFNPGELSDFQRLLLNGPVMSDEHYAEYKKSRKWK
jgi:hypothetical protein